MKSDFHLQPGRRIVVVGTSGAGKSFVARRLSEKLRVPYVCNDAILWRGNWTPNPKPQRLIEYDVATRGGAWTFDGNIGSLRNAEDAMILQRADTVVWLDLPLWEVMRQLLARTVRRSWDREELWHGNRESWRLSFASRDSILVWAWTSYAHNRRNYSAIFADERWGHLKRIRLTSRAAVDRFLSGVRKI